MTNNKFIDEHNFKKFIYIPTKNVYFPVPEIIRQKLYKNIFRSEFRILFTSAKNYALKGKERESLLFCRLCIEYIMRSMFLIHINKGEITHQTLISQFKQDGLDKILSRRQPVKRIPIRNRVRIFCNLFYASEMIQLLQGIGKLGTRENGTDYIAEWASMIAELSNKGVHININESDSNIKHLPTQAKLVFDLLQKFVEELKKL